MREWGSRSDPAMSSSGKATGASSCLSSQCFDLLTRSCVKCSDLFRDNTSKGARVAGDRAPRGWAVVGQGVWGHPRRGQAEGTFSCGWQWRWQWRMERWLHLEEEERGRGQPVPARGMQCREKRDDPARRGGGGVTAWPRGDHGKSRMASSPTSQRREQVGRGSRQAGGRFVAGGGWVAVKSHSPSPPPRL